MQIINKKEHERTFARYIHDFGVITSRWLKMKDERLKEDSEGLIERAEILKRWEIRNKIVLDIGAGPLAIIAARDFNCTVTNIDISEDAFSDVKRDAEREGVTDRITFERVDATSLSYPDDCFDVVISYGALHHIEIGKRRQCIQEACRVASEKVIVAEFSSKGFRKFHAVSDLKPVALDWLEYELESRGVLDKYYGTQMNVYALLSITVNVSISCCVFTSPSGTE